MTDRPILFSAPMVRAIIDDRKTQTRRLAWIDNNKTGENYVERARRSLWQRVQPGDRLWVREAWRANDIFPDQVVYRADCEPGAIGPWRPGIHLRRKHSRLTLEVTAVRVQELLDISEDDARAEGFANTHLNDGFGPRAIGGGYTIESSGTFASAAGMFQMAWSKLHPEWDGYSSPEVVALTFTVTKSNIDALARAA